MKNSRLLEKSLIIIKKKIKGKMLSIKRKVLKRTAGWFLSAYPDFQRLINRLHMKAYCTETGEPREIPGLSTLESFAIIEKYYSVLRGLSNYYTEYISNAAALSRWIYIIRWSCIKTLAQKYSTTKSGIIEKFGYNGTIKITVSLTDKDDQQYHKDCILLKEKDVKNASRKLKRAEILRERHANIRLKGELGRYPITQKMRTPRITDGDFLDRINWTGWRTKANLDFPCAICGKTPTEMHHIRHVRKTKYKGLLYSFERMLSLRNRKQIPLCEYHHDLVHAGHYYGTALKELEGKLYDNRIIHPENWIQKSNKIYIGKKLEEKGWKKVKGPIIQITEE